MGLVKQEPESFEMLALDSFICEFALLNASGN